MSDDRSFTAAMVQMRTSLLPEPSLEQGSKLIRQAVAEGADYVLTPEVSNMMQVNRKTLFEHPKYYGYRQELLSFLADHDVHGKVKVA